MKVDEISGSTLFQDAMATVSSHYAHLEIALQQLVDNHTARSDASRDGEDVGKRLMQKSQVRDDAALSEITSSRRYWLIRGRIPPSFGESPADI